MFATRVRFLLILAFIVIGLILHFQLGIASAWYLYLAALVLLFTHFRYGDVSAAFIQLRKGNLDKAEYLIEQIKRPDWLAKGHLAYYHFTSGMIAMQHKDWPESETQLQKALELGLRSSNDHALAALNLAHICFVEQRRDEARKYLDQAKRHQSNDLLIKQNIEELEKALA